MKLIVYVLSALLLLSASAGDSSRQDVDVSQLQNDSNLQDALKYGTNWVFEQAAKKYGVSDLNIEVTKVNTIQKWEENGNACYYFDVEADNNDASVTCQFTVKCDDNGNLSVKQWNYNLEKKDNQEQSGSYDTETETETEAPDAGTNVEINVEVDVETTVEVQEEEQVVQIEEEQVVHVEEEQVVQVEEDNNKCEQGDQVDASEVDNDSALKDALNYGINWVYKKAGDKYGVSDSDVTVTEINCICKWEDNGNTYYSFDVNADNNDASVDATYNVKCDSNGDLNVNKWSYTIDKHDNKETEVANGYDNEEDNTEHNQEVEVNVEVVVAEEEESTNKCKDIDASEIDNNSALKDALTYGVNWVVEKAHEKFGISSSDLVITKINSMCSYEEDGNTYYSFDVEAGNNDQDTVDATYNVKCESDGNLKVVNKWKYLIHYHDTQEQETEICENTEDEGSHVNEEYCQDVEVEIEVAVEENENVSRCQQGDEVDASQIDNDSDLKDALTYGIGWIFQNAAGKYGVSDSNAEVSQVNCICKWEDNGNTYYWFDVKADNNDDATIDATFNVKDNGSGDLDIVNKWNYHIDYKAKNEEENQEQELSDDCDSTEEQNLEVSEDDGQDVEVNVEINIEVNTNEEQCEEQVIQTDDNTDAIDCEEENNNDYGN